MGASSSARVRFYHEWKMRQLAARAYERQQLATYSGFRHSQRGFIINPFVFAGPATDPYWSSVVLMAHFNGSNGSSVYVDSSSNPKTMTGVVGSINQTTGAYKYGTASCAATWTPAGYNRIDVTHDAELNLPGDSTIECWCYWNATNTTNFSPVFFAKRNASTQLEYSFAYINGVLGFYFSTNGTTLVTTCTVSWTPSTSTWYHIAFSRSGSTGRFFINGTQQGADQTVSGTIHSNTRNASVFGDSVNVGLFNGYMDDMRVTKGVARYTSSFTAPGAQFPDS